MLAPPPQLRSQAASLELIWWVAGIERASRLALPNSAAEIVYQA